MTAYKKSKQQNQAKKAQYNLDRQTAKILALSSGNAGKQEFLKGEDILPEKDYWLLLEIT